MNAPSPTSFTFEPLFLLLCAVAAVLYVRAARKEGGLRWKHAAPFGIGLLLIAGALNSPLETLSVHYLLTIHILQNVMIADWAPPILILGLTPAMRAAIARRGGAAFAWVTRPKIALTVWLVGWYGIHLAGFYDFALRNPWMLNIEHAALIAIGLLFWWPALTDFPQVLSPLITALYLFAGFLGASFLGHALLVAPTPFYDYYTEVPRLGGLSATADQTYAGLLMNLEQAAVFLVAIGYFLARSFREEDERWGRVP